jgi:hypothetical protein
MSRMLRALGMLLLLLVVASAGGSATSVAGATDGDKLSVASTGLGSLTITPHGDTLRCNSASCEYEFALGTTVVVQTQPWANSVLAEWEGPGVACAEKVTFCRLLLVRDTVVTAHFSQVPLYVEWNEKLGTVKGPPHTNCGPSCWLFSWKTSVTLTATPKDEENYFPSGWWGGTRCFNNCTTALLNARRTGREPLVGRKPCGAICALELLDATRAVAQFSCKPDHEEQCGVGRKLGTRQQGLGLAETVYIKVKGRGTVRIVEGNEQHQCKSVRSSETCPFDEPRASRLALEARPDGTAGTRFAGWSGTPGGCAGRAPRCQFRVFADASGGLPQVLATFR